MSNRHVQSAKAIAEDIAHLCCVPDDWRLQISDLTAWPFPTFCAKARDNPTHCGFSIRNNAVKLDKLRLRNFPHKRYFLQVHYACDISLSDAGSPPLPNCGPSFAARLRLDLARF